jgi:hypothetical protein
MCLGLGASVLLCSCSQKGRIRGRLYGFWSNWASVGVRSVCLLIMGRVIMGRYWMVFCVRIQRCLGFSIFQSILRRLIQWSRAGSQGVKLCQIGFYCRCRLQNITCAKRLTAQTLCLKCSNIYQISYKSQFLETNLTFHTVSTNQRACGVSALTIR